MCRLVRLSQRPELEFGVGLDSTSIGARQSHLSIRLSNLLFETTGLYEDGR